jgi:hypothetical protein
MYVPVFPLVLQAVVKDLNQDLAAGSSSSSGGGGSAPAGSAVWEGLLHIVGAINYGGRVTDPDDRRLLAAIVQQHLSPEVLTGRLTLGQPGGTMLGAGTSRGSIPVQ